jgi:hypothetical protein
MKSYLKLFFIFAALCAPVSSPAQSGPRTTLGIVAQAAAAGTAIYATRPWKKFGEGRIRFTTKGENLYAIALGWPTNGIAIASLATTNSGIGKISGVELLGHQGALEFSQDDGGLKIKLPAGKPCDFAYAFKITGLKLK